MISGFHHSVNEICALLGFYTAYIGLCYGHFETIYRSHLQELPTFRDNLSVLEGGTRQVVPKRRQQTTNLRCVKSQTSEDLTQISCRRVGNSFTLCKCSFCSVWTKQQSYSNSLPWLCSYTATSSQFLQFPLNKQGGDSAWCVICSQINFKSQNQFHL